MSNAIVTLNRQEAFNRAWEGLKNQGFIQCSFKDGGGCSYDGPEGRKCAWGWVDPVGTADRKTFNKFTGEEVTQQVGGTVGYLACQTEYINLAQYLGEGDLQFAAALQRAHDSAEGPDDMKARLIKVALDEGLTVPGLDPVALTKAKQVVQNSMVVDNDTAQRVAINIVAAFAA